MHEERLECPRCRGGMQIGFLVDRGDGNARAVAQWVQGKPERNFWIGLSFKDRAVLPVTTYRCERCGYLESYAVADA